MKVLYMAIVFKEQCPLLLSTCVQLLITESCNILQQYIEISTFFPSVLDIGKINEASLVFSLPATDNRLLKKKILNLV